MKIVGSSKQEGTPKPDNPVQITNETVLIITDKEGNKKEMPFNYKKVLKEGDKIEKINGKWYLVRRKPMIDIEILEDYLDKQDRKFASEYKLMILEAIENLIQRNKDLEQIEKEHKEENGRLRDKIKELEIEKENEFKRGFFTKVAENKANTLKIESQVIPTSKLFKKIEKKIKLFRKMGFNEAYSALIDLYEELLEEREK